MTEDNEPQEPTFLERVRKRAKTLAEGAKLLGQRGLTSARDAVDQVSSATGDLTNTVLEQTSALSEEAKEAAVSISVSTSQPVSRAIFS